MKISRQYLLGLGSGLILSALIALPFTPGMVKSSGTTGASTKSSPATTTVEKATATSTEANPLASSPQTTAPSVQGASGTGPVSATAQTKKSFVIPSGASAEKIAQLLQSEGWIQEKEDFLARVKAQKLEKRFKAGTYELVPGLSIEDIIERLIA